MKLHTLLLIVVLCWVGLAACRPQEDATPEENPPVEGEVESDAETVLVLEPKALASNNGAWELDSESIEVQEREVGLILTARYVNSETQAVGNLTLTRYKNAADAQQVFTERQTAEVEAVTAFGDGAYLLGNMGLVLADPSGIAEVEMSGETFNRYDTLGLLQVGMNTLLHLTPAYEMRGYLGDPDIENETESESES